MKAIITTLAIVGVTLVALRGAGPGLAARARQKCLEMCEGTSSPCSPQRTIACAEPSCSGQSPAHR